MAGWRYRSIAWTRSMVSASVGGLVVAVAADPGEAQRDAAGVAGRDLDAVERDLDHLLGPDVHDVAVAAGASPILSSRKRSVCQRSSSSVRPLNVLPTITKSPSAPRAPRWRFDSQPWRRPWPHSTASTTRSSVCTGLTLRQAPPRRPASYGGVEVLDHHALVAGGERPSRKALGLGRRRR